MLLSFRGDLTGEGTALRGYRAQFTLRAGVYCERFEKTEFTGVPTAHIRKTILRKEDFQSYHRHPVGFNFSQINGKQVV